ncbi:MAG: tripartite tricarboxylate transporter substrate binding protein [Burkholderiales bacterium]|nr:tripartite tricarboxylate transporter substrate binding protein [Burkholderiales bacterium]
MKVAKLLRCFAMVLLAVVALPRALAEYPDKPIRIVSGFAPGGSLDTLARMIGEKLYAAWGQPVVVQNKVGAGGQISGQTVARANPDGHTLLMVTPGFMAAAPHLYPNLPYDPIKDFAPITRLVVGAYLLAVRPTLPVNDLAGFIALARSQPGKISMANAGTASATHLNSEYFALMAGIRVAHIPYKGSAPATLDLLGGRVDAQLTDMSTLAAHVRSGKLKGLAVMGAERSELLPDVPTGMESAMPGVRVETWFGIVAPAGTPKAIIEKLNREMVRIMALSDVKARLAQMGFVPATLTPEATADLMKADIEQMGDVIKKTGVKVE